MKTFSHHILYLINEGYDLKQATIFVGNHFQFSERQRLAIMRSVASDQDRIKRKSKQLSLFEKRLVWMNEKSVIHHKYSIIEPTAGVTVVGSRGIRRRLGDCPQAWRRFISYED